MRSVVEDSTMIDCSMIIPVLDQDDPTQRCLDAILALSPPRAGFEIIVVDDGSAPATARMLAGYGRRVRVLRHERSRGFAASCNDGAAVARGRHLVFLDNDTLPLSGSLDALLDYADA